jgi:radical SAM protein with 4Fe4S-binding SPASM domain
MKDRVPSESFLPATAVLEMTYRCNHACKFCSCPWEDTSNGFTKRNELTKNRWMQLLAQLSESGVSNIAFTGGEALLRNDLPQIIRYASTCVCNYVETVDGELVTKRKPVSLYLLSNGKKVTKSAIDMCKKYNVQLSMSMPGLNTFKYHTGSDSADRVLDAFSRAKKAGLKTVANITVTKINLPELERVIAAVLLAGADQILLNRFLPGGRGLKYNDELSLSAGELVRMLDIAESVLAKAQRYGALGTEVPLCIVDTQRYTRIKIGTKCSAAKHFFVIGPSGYIRVCNHSPVELNHIDTIMDLKSDNYWKMFTQSEYKPQHCIDCTHTYECDGGCREAAHITGGTLCSTDSLLSGIIDGKSSSEK